MYQTARVNTYRFNTDSGVEYAVIFDHDDLLQSCESYQFVITNVNHKKSPRDSKVRTTILLIIEEFFRQNNTTLLYICESGDGKQNLRNRLFDYWFAVYKGNDRFVFLSTSIQDEEGIDNYAALIVRKDNPRLTSVITEFTQTVQVLSQK